MTAGFPARILWAASMLDPTPIRSNTNPEVKRVRAALRGKERGVLVLEGERLVGDAVASGLDLQLVMCSEACAPRAEEFQSAGIDVRLASDSVLSSLSELSNSPGMLALVSQPERRTLSVDAVPGEQALVVVAAGIADPGNLGALARTAEAAGASAMVVVEGGCRPWNPKALRGSMGSLLRLPVFEMASCAEAWDALGSAGFGQVLAYTRGGEEPARLDWSGRTALWLTSETGEWPGDLSQRADQSSAKRVTIPLAAGVESLNVTSAAAVLLFAAGRTGARGDG